MQRIETVTSVSALQDILYLSKGGVKKIFLDYVKKKKSEKQYVFL